MINGYSLRLKAALAAGSCAAALFCAPAAAAQEGNTLIGPPQLRDFQLEPRQRIVTQPRPAPATTPEEAAPEPAERATTRPFTPAPGPQASGSAPPAARPSAPAAPAAQPRGTVAPQPERPVAASDRSVAAPTAAPANAVPTAAAQDSLPPPAPEPVVSLDPVVPTAPAGQDLPEGPPAWLFFLAFATLGLLGYGYWLRRRSLERRALALPGADLAPELAPPVPAQPRAPRPAPQPRPWLEVEIAAQRARVNVEETVIEFDLTVRNSGGTEARNVRLQARMFPSTPEQDKQIGAYFKSDGSEYRTIALPPIPAGGEISVNGSVDMKRDRISALKVDGKLLLVPLVAVTARYEWGTNRFGQTGRSWVIGREQTQAGSKMGAFRLDLGARVYRTIGQRPHNVSRRI